MRSREQTDDPFVNLSDLTEIELLILRRMREFTIGDHRSMFHGTGYDFVGLREWQPGDRLAAIDWPQSSITNFSPLIVRDFDQPSTAGVMAVADVSPSTRCGVGGTPIAAAVARAIGTIGISAVFFQDTFGLITFDAGFKHLAAVRPRIGKNQVIHCLDAYQHNRGLEDVRPAETLSRRIAGYIRKPSLVPVISDFLFDDARTIIAELTMLNSVHDVVLVLIDSGFAFEVPPVSAGWVEAFDVETGRARVISRATLRGLADRAREWQDDVRQMAKHAGMDVLRLGLDEVENAISLSEFVAERRLRKA
jgi:uncharacterized protein (DUF58 family)